MTQINDRSLTQHLIQQGSLSGKAANAGRLEKALTAARQHNPELSAALDRLPPRERESVVRQASTKLRVKRNSNSNKEKIPKNISFEAQQHFETALQGYVGRANIAAQAAAHHAAHARDALQGRAARRPARHVANLPRIDQPPVGERIGVGRPPRGDSPEALIHAAPPADVDTGALSIAGPPGAQAQRAQAFDPVAQFQAARAEALAAGRRAGRADRSAGVGLRAPRQGFRAGFALPGVAEIW